MMGGRKPKMPSLMPCLLVFTLVQMITPPAAEADRLIVTARQTAVVPRGPDDPAWQRSIEAPIPVKGRGAFSNEEGIIHMRAVYTAAELYLLFRWKDPTRSTTKQAWVYDGHRWNHLEGNEDRIALLFEITRIHNFATRGCAVTCHSPADLPQDQWKLATTRAEEKGDLWHWKAARSDPYNHADDGWLTVAGHPSGAYRETGRRNDGGDGGDVINQTPDGTRPLYMQDPLVAPSVPGFLLFEEAATIADNSIFKPGDILPFRLPRQPSGSRFDVKALSRHADGEWSVMLHRCLNTGQDDDVVFIPARQYSFAIAVFDDSGADHSKATLPLTLEFER
jgi:hypothetical protein